VIYIDVYTSVYLLYIADHYSSRAVSCWIQYIRFVCVTTLNEYREIWLFVNESVHHKTYIPCYLLYFLLFTHHSLAIILKGYLDVRRTSCNKTQHEIVP